MDLDRMLIRIQRKRLKATKGVEQLFEAEDNI